MEEFARRVAQIGGLDRDARLQELLDALPHGVFEIDLEGRLTFGNVAFYALFGAEPGQLEGTVLWTLASDDTHRAELAAFLAGLRDARSGTGTYFCRQVDRSGSPRHLRLDLSHKPDDAGDLVGYAGTVTDVTDDVVRERLEDRFRLISDHLGALIAYVDRDERYQFANATYREWYGLGPEDIIGRPVREILGEEIHARLKPLIDRALAGERIDFEITVPSRTDGGGDALRDVSVDYLPDTQDGHVMGFYALIRDVTARNEAKDLSQEASQLLDVAFSALDIAVAYMDRDFRFIRVNETYARADGKSVEFFPGRQHFDLYPDMDNESVFRDVVATGKAYHCHARPFEYADAPERGTTHWDWSLVPVKRREGEVAGVVLVLIDVTDRIKTLEKIKESEARFQAIFDNAAEAMIMADEDSLELVMANPAACRWLGYAADEWRSLTVRDIHPESAHSTVLAKFMLLSAGKIDQAPEIPLLRKDGSVFHADVSGAAVQLDGKRYLCGFFRDATARLQARRTMLRHNAELQAQNRLDAARIAQQSQVIQQVHDAIIGLELDGSIASWNAGAARMFGQQSDDVQGLSFARMLGDENARDELSDWLARVDRYGEFEHEAEFKGPNGRHFHAMISLSLLRDPHGTPGGYFAYCLDISERKQTESAMKSAMEAAQRANQAKSQFLSRMSHELRTPMNAILGFAQLLAMDRELSEPQRDSVDEIQAAGQHLLALINDMLDLSRIENGRLNIDVQPVRVGEMVHEVLQIAARTAADANISITSTITCSCAVAADPLRLRQILINLVTNAIKYNRDGGQVWVHCPPAREGRICIAVEDTGVGIPNADRARVFEPFERLYHKAEVEGVGIGLALSSQLIELMNGTIGVAGRDGGGSRFWIDLPLATSD